MVVDVVPIMGNIQISHNFSLEGHNDVKEAFSIQGKGLQALIRFEERLDGRLVEMMSQIGTSSR